MDFIVSFFCKKDEPIKDNSDEEAKLVNNTNPIGEVITPNEDDEPAITEQVENTVNNDDKKDEVDAVINPDEVEDALMKAEETGDEDTLIQIVEEEVDNMVETEIEDALMKAEEKGDEDTLIQIVEDMLMNEEIEEDDEESI
jgi:hypothetical protein